MKTYSWKFEKAEGELEAKARRAADAERYLDTQRDDKERRDREDFALKHFTWHMCKN